MEVQKVKSTKVKAINMEKNAELQDEDSSKLQLAKVEAAAVRQNTFSKVTDAVAQSDHWEKNRPIPFAKEIWPHEDYRYCYSDLYYPYAHGGPIYMDLPCSPYEVTMCELKHKKLLEKGVRYTYLGPNEGEAEMLARLPHPLPQGDPQRKEAMI